MQAYRVYIDESGDHSYRTAHNLDTRYLALTAVVVVKRFYDTSIQPSLEALKKRHFAYDPDDPVVLHRSDIIKLKGAFGVLREPARRAAWGTDLLTFIQQLQAQVFTVVIDKHAHRQAYPIGTFDPYDYSLSVLLERIRGFLNVQHAQADVIAESRGKKEDAQLQAAYDTLRTVGGGRYGTAAEYQAVFPDPLVIMKKERNVAGLQIADLLAYGQRAAIALADGRPLAVAPSAYTLSVNAAAAHMINRYGAYLLV